MSSSERSERNGVLSPGHGTGVACSIILSLRARRAWGVPDIPSTVRARSSPPPRGQTRSSLHVSPAVKPTTVMPEVLEDPERTTASGKPVVRRCSAREAGVEPDPWRRPARTVTGPVGRSRTRPPPGAESSTAEGAGTSTRVILPASMRTYPADGLPPPCPPPQEVPSISATADRYAANLLPKPPLTSAKTPPASILPACARRRQPEAVDSVVRGITLPRTEGVAQCPMSFPEHSP